MDELALSPIANRPIGVDPCKSVAKSLSILGVMTRTSPSPARTSPPLPHSLVPRWGRIECRHGLLKFFTLRKLGGALSGDLLSNRKSVKFDVRDVYRKPFRKVRVIGWLG